MSGATPPLSVYDRLYDVRSYTGTQAGRATGSGKKKKGRKSFVGNTNTGTDEVIRDISQITRPNLNRTPSRKPSRNNQSKAELSMEAAVAGGLPATLDTNAQLKLIFRYYCRFGRTTGNVEKLHNANWAKFCRECPGLLDRRAVTNAEIDLIFTKSKSKTDRRLGYGRFLDALSALAAKKFPDTDPATGFSMLLARHVFRCPAAVGGGESIAPSSTQRRRRSSTGKARRGSRGAPQAPSPSTGRRSQRRTPAPAPGATVSQQNHANAGSSGPRQARRSGLNLFGDDEPLMFTSGNGTGHDGAPSLPQPSHSGGGSLSHPRQAPAQPPLAQAGPPGASASQAGTYQYTSYAAAVASARAAAAAHAAQTARNISDASQLQQQQHATPAAGGPAPATSGTGSGGGVAPPHGAPASRASATATAPAPAAPTSRGLSPATIAATAAAAAAAAASAQSQQDDGAAAAASALYHATYAAHAAQLAMAQAAAQARAHGIELPPSLASSLSAVGGPVAPSQPFTSPYRPSAVHGQGLSMPAQTALPPPPGPAAAAAQPAPHAAPPATPERRKRRGSRRSPRGGAVVVTPGSAKRKGLVATASFRPRKSTLPGEGIRPGSVYDRLTNPGSFTGVYRRAWESDGRINAHADHASMRRFRGNTNTNTNSNIHDISMTLRPNLSSSPLRRPSFR